jgi:hypothetical protein
MINKARIVKCITMKGRGEIYVRNGLKKGRRGVGWGLERNVFLKAYLNIFYFIYLLTAIGLSPGGSTHLHTNNT